ncbi:DUF5134 domain-containing protein [Kitasatospora sp. GAS204B]|uniref:DUF5134 domain-containing protein n=1 Tax=unclassified Kitasatospora TaxID=2633591 RepID=UPI0024753AC4|nr:DUF5134 domain-containing protein [Kitasatospora sp. GAS204B]MDH6120340.1 hypothetical protein [Kitasatospora sp. GAS204B]
MHGPAVLSWLLALLTTATGGLCLLRLRRPPGCTASPMGRGGAAGRGDAAGHRGGRGSDAAEAAMALGTAAMIALGGRLPPPLWVGLFGLLGAASLCAAAGRRAGGHRAHRLHHAVGAAAMVYMALAMGRAPRPAHPGMAMAMPMGLPALTGLLLVYFGCYTLWSGSRLLTVPGHPDVATAGWPPGPLPEACRLAMGVGMFAMLLAL